MEAGKYNVLPIDGDVRLRLVVDRPQTSKPRSRFTYYPGLSVVPVLATPKILNRPHSIEADVEIPSAGAEGILLAQGGAAGGFVFYVKDGKLHYAHNYAAKDIFEVASQDALSPWPASPAVVPPRSPDGARSRTGQPLPGEWRLRLVVEQGP